MIAYRDLTRVFIRSLKINKANQKGGRFFFRFLIFFSIVFVFLPFLAIFTIFIADMMRQLNEVGYASIGFELLLSLISIFIFVFRFNVLLNELYFSEDMEHLLPLPIRPDVLVASKFTSCFFVENLIFFVFLFFACSAYLFALDLPAYHLVLSFIGMILVPLAPMAYCVILSFFLFRLFRKIMNRKVMKMIGLVFLGLLIIGIVFLFYKLSSFNFEQYVETFAQGDHKFLEVTRIIFPSIYYFVDGLHSGSLVAVLISILINVITFLVMIFLADFFYYDGVIAFSSHDTNSKKSSALLMNHFKVKEASVSYFEKEFKYLFRSPTFFINCLLINIIWPIFLFLIFKMGLPSYTISHMKDLALNADSSILITCFLSHLGVSIMVPAFNSLASSSFSREGKNYLFIKYIPMSYGVQWRIKFWVSVLISYLGVNFYMMIFYGLIHFPVLYSILFYIFSLLCVFLVSFIGLLIDSNYPKIVWDDENDALRENYNAFIAMGFSVLFFGLLCGGGYYLYHYHGFSFISLVFIAFLILFFVNLILYFLSKINISSFIRNQEV